MVQSSKQKLVISYNMQKYSVLYLVTYSTLHIYVHQSHIMTLVKVLNNFTLLILNYHTWEIFGGGKFGEPYK